MPDKTYTQKEISVALNNAVVAALHPSGVKISEPRLRQLREFTKALVGIAFDYTTNEEEKFLSPQELVAVLACAALYAQTTLVTKSDKLPAADTAKQIFES